MESPFDSEDTDDTGAEIFVLLEVSAASLSEENNLEHTENSEKMFRTEHNPINKIKFFLRIIVFSLLQLYEVDTIDPIIYCTMQSQ